MPYLHFLIAILATWRITELFTQDRITARLRQRFPTYLWQCPRCMSVWAGSWATLMLALSPFTHGITAWSLWPFGIAWLYLAHVDWVVGRRASKEGRKMIIEAKGPQWTLARNEFSPQETQEILMRIMAPQAQNQPPVMPPSYINGA